MGQKRKKELFIKMKISTSWAFAVSLTLLVGAFIWTTFYEDAPFPLFISGIGYFATLYGFRRYKLKISNGKTEGS